MFSSFKMKSSYFSYIKSINDKLFIIDIETNDDNEIELLKLYAINLSFSSSKFWTNPSNDWLNDEKFSIL